MITQSELEELGIKKISKSQLMLLESPSGIYARNRFIFFHNQSLINPSEEVLEEKKYWKANIQNALKIAGERQAFGM